MTSRRYQFRANARTVRQLTELAAAWDYADSDNTSELMRKVIDSAHAATFGKAGGTGGAEGGVRMKHVRVLSQSVVGYRRQGTESVYRTVWLMDDGTTETLYDGSIHIIGEPTRQIEYGTICPSIDTPQPEGER